MLHFWTYLYYHSLEQLCLTLYCHKYLVEPHMFLVTLHNKCELNSQLFHQTFHNKHLSWCMVNCSQYNIQRGSKTQKPTVPMHITKTLKLTTKGTSKNHYIKRFRIFFFLKKTFETIGMQAIPRKESIKSHKNSWQKSENKQRIRKVPEGE